MPYKDPEKSRNYQREYKQLQRAGSSQTPCQTQIPSSFRLQTARDVLLLIEEQVQTVKSDPKVETIARARTIGYLAGIALRAVEAVQIVGRVEALEEILSQRNGAK